MKNHLSDYNQLSSIVRSLTLLAALVFCGSISVAAPLGTAFTYQGRLNDGPNPANGNYDLKFNSWSSLSDRNMKENLRPVATREILMRLTTIPISEWNLTSQDPAIRHIGPMAQDFAAAFGVGEDNRHISTSDADGVALAAIQGLNQKLEEAVKAKDAQIQALEKDLTALKAVVEKLAQHGNGGIQ